MLKFIVCEDNTAFLVNNCQIINQTMMNLNIDYKIIRCKDYNSELKSAIKADGPKIYIIDLELPTKMGLDIVREIRSNDYYSQVIISSAHYELENLAFKSKLMIMDFVSKYDDHDKKLQDAIGQALRALGKKVTINIINKSGELLIDISDIVYILKTNLDRKCTIVTRNGEYNVNKSLCEFEKKFDSLFIKTHRCCLINPKYVSGIDYTESTILFSGGLKLSNMISRNYKKRVQQLWS